MEFLINTNVFRCPSDEELSPLARRFFPFPRFPVPQDDTVIQNFRLLFCTT